MTRIAAFVLTLVFSCTVWSQPNMVTPAHTLEVRQIVQKQLDAFAADDADKAFSYAAPEIQKLFGTPARFLAMVRAQYPMVHRPATIAFQIPQAEGQSVLQRVLITDAQGKSWTASYLVSRQKNQSWRIGACVVERAQPRFMT